MRFYVTNIDWDTNTSEGYERSLHLPEDVVVQSDQLHLEDFDDDEKVGYELSNYLGIRFGFRVNSFSYIDEAEVIGGERVN